MAKKTPEQIADEEERTTAFGLLSYAHQYQRASVMVHERDSKSVVPYMLVAHSLELAMKAYLRSQGSSVASMKKSGHSLPKLHRASLEKGLERFWPQAAALLPALEVLEFANAEQALRYIITGTTHRPDWSTVTECAEAMIDAVKGPCLIQTFGDAEAAVMLQNRGRSNLFPQAVPA
ncbi:hypothetical protein PWP89_09700 [Stenotrophomonas rhizophila]|uniref:hypothetical protein n=1 Tax=Stenotrophomonas rhizophila TaxID=216778 RepID=UPI000B884BEF|nr:hypothetical protein [Stenotrophomonas rhizophila]